MSKKYQNKKKKKFLASLAVLPSLDNNNNDLTKRCKFNFSYFDHSQAAGQKFSEWNHKQLYDLLNKLQNFTKMPLSYWQNQKIGGSKSKVLTIYGEFPIKTNFVCPKNIPHQVKWGRFRLGSKLRLVGFKIPSSYHNKIHHITNEFFDTNTFYVVFLDRDHEFYLTK